MYYTKKSKEAQLHPLISSVIFLFVLIIPTSIIVTNTPLVYGQTNQTIAENEDLLNIQDIPAKKVHVGDIEIAYKMLGKGDPILLFNGGSDGMDAWDPSFPRSLSSNHTVIVFDSRGIGNTTSGSKPYTYQQLANDTAGLLDALKIPKADVLGYSLGSYIAQQLAIMYPDKVNSLVLVGSSCGGKDHTPKPPEFLKLQSEIVNKSLNNVSISQEEMKALVSASLGSGWIRLHPESLENIPTLQQAKPGLSPDAMNNQNNVGKHWEDNPNWSGACDELAKIAKPTLVITGTDDNNYQPHVNSLKIVEKIPGAWLIQIKDAGHAIMDQYPEEIGKIVNTFLSTTSTPPS
ncbi:MAG: alpha/beta hydrolase [Thermoproteota archaeon]|nr:alpha/beta hydrolase [Thermoproteota archaeon]